MKLVLQEILEDHNEVVSYCPLLVAAQVLDLVDQVDEIEAVESALLKQPRLLFDP
jgi:hypothetical protein